MLLILMIVACTLAAVVQTAVLRDRTIVETELIEALRTLRIVAHGVAAASGCYLWAAELWLQPMFALSVTILAGADIVGAAARLFPHAVEAPPGRS